MTQSRTRYPLVTPLPPLIVVRRSRRVHLAVAFTATARQLNGPRDCLAIPPKNEIKMRTKIYGCQHFEMLIVMQHTYFGSHHVIILHLFGILKC